MVTTFAVIIGGGFVGEYRISQAEARVEKIEVKLEAQDDTLDDLRADVGQLCAAEFGPEKCYTRARRR